MNSVTSYGVVGAHVDGIETGVAVAGGDNCTVSGCDSGCDSGCGADDGGEVGVVIAASGDRYREEFFGR
jgi:hypothetical protein